MSVDVLPQVEAQEGIGLHPGPYWDSFEQFRTGGAQQLQTRLGPEQVGRIRVKGQEYVIMRSQTFNRLHGLAQDIHRLRRALLLIRQAVQLVMHTGGAKLAVEHLRDLTFQLPELQTLAAAPRRELVFADDERAAEDEGGGDEPDFELDPARVRRPAFGVSE